VGDLLKLPPVGIAIGLAGGSFLVWMGVAMFKDLNKADGAEPDFAKGGPLTTGIVLSGSNPYFLIWWATVGLTLITMAKGLGVWAFALFALVHWSCDVTWLTVLSWASFKGTNVLGPKRRRFVLLFCAVVLVGFGLYFIGDKSVALIRAI